MSALTTIEGKALAFAPELATLMMIVAEAQQLTGVGGSGAAVAIKVIEAAIEALKVNAAGVLTHDEIMTQLHQAASDLAAARAGEDADLAARFPAAP